MCAMRNLRQSCCGAAISADRSRQADEALGTKLEFESNDFCGATTARRSLLTRSFRGTSFGQNLHRA
jgi:hypothetical protein